MEDDADDPLLSELLRGGRAPRLVPGCQNDGDAAGGQLPAHLEPDPLVPAGDHGNPTPTFEPTATSRARSNVNGRPGLIES